MKSRTIAIAIASALLAAPTLAQTFTEGHLQVLDTDGDGAVSEAEYMAYMDAAFTQLDTANNGVLEASDLNELLTEAQFDAADADGDGRVSRAEFDARVMADFEAADRSGTGALE